MSLAIVGMGTAVPETVYRQDEALVVARGLCCQTDEQRTWLPTMYNGTGIQQRHTVMSRAFVDDMIHGTRSSGSVYLPDAANGSAGPSTAQRMLTYREQAFPLALDAARMALDDCEIDPARITHLVTVSCTGFHAPGVDTQLMHALDLVPTVQRTNIGFMGCHGALNGLRVARAFADSEPTACVLLCAVELCSIHYHYTWDPGKVIANAIFADGAAALVGESSKQKPAGARIQENLWRVIASGSYLFPGTADAMTWTVGDSGFSMTLSKKVPGLIRENLRPWLSEWLRSHELSIDGVASWAIHPGGPRIVDAVEEALDLAPEQTATARDVFSRYGNMSSPTVFFILEEMRRQNAPRPCVALGFGPGLVVEAALFG